VGSEAHKTCSSSETVQDDQSYYYGLIGSRICAFGWHQIYRPWMTLNGWNAPFAEIDKNKKVLRRPPKNVNEDRHKLSAA